jgi:hypothetical protein
MMGPPGLGQRAASPLRLPRRPGTNVTKLFCPRFTDFRTKRVFRLVRKSLPITNTLAYYKNPKFTDKNVL